MKSADATCSASQACSPPNPREVGLRLVEIGAQRLDRAAIDDDGVEEPPLLLLAVIELLRPFQRLAHPAHARGELRDVREEDLALEITHHLVAIEDRIEGVEWRLEEGHEVVLRLSGRDRCDDLVEIEVGEERRRGFRSAPDFLARIEDALELHAVPRGATRPAASAVRRSRRAAMKPARSRRADFPSARGARARSHSPPPCW